MGDDTKGWTVVDESVAPDVSSPTVKATSSSTPSATSVLATAAAIRAGLPVAARTAEEIATNPNVAKSASALARGAMTVGAVAHGLYAGSPTEVLAAPVEGWAAGKGAYWLAKGAQKLSAPVAKVLRSASDAAEAITDPAVEVAGKILPAQGVLDLAKMAEPNRKDIGFLGIAPTMDSLEVLKAAIAKGANPASAAATIAQGDPQKFGALMTAYMKSRQAQ